MEKGVPIRSVSRSISVLQAINRHGSLSMMAIAKHGALPYPTAFRIVQTLLHEGLIEQEPARKRYRPTALVQSLAYGYKSESQLIDAARPHIRELTRQVGWPVFVSVRVGAQMVVRDATHGETSLTFGPCHPGFTVPLLTSATGQACLAYDNRSELNEVIGWLTAAKEEQTSRINLDDMFNTLQHVRAEGYAAKQCENGSPNKTASIAAPIMRDGQIEAVLTLIYFAAAMKQTTAIERYLGTVKKAADAISRDLNLSDMMAY